MKKYSIMSEQSVIIEVNMVRSLSSEKHDLFLQSALTLFVENGVTNTSTAEIAKAAGTAAGTLFLYFPTKQDLINTLTLKISKDVSEAIRSLLSPALSAHDSFWTIWQGTINWFLTNRAAYLYIRQIRDSGILDEKTIQESDLSFSYYYEAIQKGFTENCINPYPIELIGNFLYHNITAVTDILLAQPDVQKHPEYIQLGFEIFWNGITFKKG